MSVFDENEKVTPIVTLRELLGKNHIFRVPDYQRGFAWSKEFETLWKDILYLQKRTTETNSLNVRKHYTGMLALEEIKDEQTKKDESICNDSNAFYIVDGQQRITSLIIILSSIINYLREENFSFDFENYNNYLYQNNRFKFAYSTGTKNTGIQKYFENRIYRNNNKFNATNGYMQNINHAKDYIDQELNKRNNEEIFNILELLLNNIVFNIYFVTSDFDVRVTFETMNNRGKKLSNLELLKNRLMYLSTFFNKDVSYGEELKDKINDAWAEIYENLSYGDAHLSDDMYLKAHWIVYKRFDKAKGDKYISDILDNYFAVDCGDFYDAICNSDCEQANAIIDDYVTSIQNYSAYWAIVNKPNNPKPEINIDGEILDELKKLSRETDNLFCKATSMVVLASNLNKTDMLDFFRKLELSLFIHKIIGQSRNDYSFLISRASELLNSKENSKTECFNKLKNDLMNHSDLGLTKIQTVKAINNFIHMMKNEKNGNYFAWNGKKYFLYEYNEKVELRKFKGKNKDDYDNISIEHILPQNPNTDKTNYWKIAFEKYINNDDIMNKLINSLGNMVVLANASENSSLSNYSYPAKRGTGENKSCFTYFDGTNASREIAVSEKYWTINQIYKYSSKLLDFMYENWFSNISDFTEREWEKYKKQLIFFEPISDTEYSDLTLKLNSDDYEVEIRTDHFESEKEDYEIKQIENRIKEFFRPELKVKFNKKKAYYLENQFSCLLKKSKESLVFETHIRVNGEKIRILYKLEGNKMCIYSCDRHCFYKSYTDLRNEGINNFINSFYKYVRKVHNRSNPSIVQE